MSCDEVTSLKSVDELYVLDCLTSALQFISELKGINDFMLEERFSQKGYVLEGEDL